MHSVSAVSTVLAGLYTMVGLLQWSLIKERIDDHQVQQDVD